ncbi:MAG: hypothetical protein ACUZ8O_11715 [Candidatus Anammoxibacter sp.]
MSNINYNKNEKTIIDKKIDETWNILKDVEKELNKFTDFTITEKEVVLIRKFEFALTNELTDHLLIIEDEKQDLQCVNFKATKSLENYDFKTGKTIFFVHMDKKRRVKHLGGYEYESRYWDEAIPVRLQILDLSKNGDTISVEFLYDRERLKLEGSCKKGPSGANLIPKVIPRVIGRIDMESLSEWLIYLYNCDIITDNIGLALRKDCETGMITTLDSFLEKLCEEFSSCFQRFTAKPGDWLKIYLLLYANITNNLLVVTDDSDDTPKDDLVPGDFVETPLGVS